MIYKQTNLLHFSLLKAKSSVSQCLWEGGSPHPLVGNQMTYKEAESPGTRPNYCQNVMKDYTSLLTKDVGVDSMEMTSHVNTIVEQTNLITPSSDHDTESSKAMRRGQRGCP